MDKQEYRTRIWELMTDQEVGAFPFPLHNRIPNFKGASQAASQLENLSEWENAVVIKANPDAPQRYARKLALQSQKIVYMAVPRLRERECFVKIDVSSELARKASSIKGSFEYGSLVHPNKMEPVDLVITGSVVVNNLGHRIGKGGGYADLELAILSSFDLLTPSTPIITTIHPIQVVDDPLPQEQHDIQLSRLVTPDEIIECPTQSFSAEINWKQMSQEKIRSIPILQDLAGEKTDH